MIWRMLHWGFIQGTGFTDEAGAVFTHFSAGVAALIVALALGPRRGKYNRDGSTNAVPGHNLTLVAAGVFLLMVMWIPYVAGYASDQPAAAMNAILAGSAGLLAACLYCQIFYGRQDVLLVYSGLMGGLVSITAGADLIPGWGAVLAGAVAGAILPWMVVRLDLILKVDDPAGGVMIHGMGGILSVIAVTLLAHGPMHIRLEHLWGGLLALAVSGALTAVVAGCVFYGLKHTLGIRVREADEFDGLDLSQFELNAYPDFQQTTIKSYHLREM
jgi:Amt family ammonium transporter